jgi:hypothetical protein
VYPACIKALSAFVLLEQKRSVSAGISVFTTQLLSMEVCDSLKSMAPEITIEKERELQSVVFLIDVRSD